MTHPLDGVRVIESGDSTIDFCGLMLAGLGAQVIKVEPPGGAESRRLGPYSRAKDDSEFSLFFSTYNRGKESLEIDQSSSKDRATVQELASQADVWIDAGTPGEYRPFLGVNTDDLRAINPGLITASLTPFGRSGPWAEYRSSDLVQLALGGVLMNCGYDPSPQGEYDTPPIWPQAFHSLAIAGEQLFMGILGALFWRSRSGEGQALECALHEAVSKCTELDLMSWVMLRTPFSRQTSRHSAPVRSAPTIAQTKDGRWLNVMTLGEGDRAKLRSYLSGFGIDNTTGSEAGIGIGARNVPGTGDALSEDSQRDVELIQRLTRRILYKDLPWIEAQEAGLLWAPIRKPHENAEDAHWLARDTFTDIYEPELDRDVRYPSSKWRSTSSSWSAGGAAPPLDSGHEMVTAWSEGPSAIANVVVRDTADEVQPKGRRWALEGVRVFDFSWFLASAGGTRFLAAMGAECIKVEWSAHPDTRLGAGAPVGGRDARDHATTPLSAINDPDMGGNFNHKNAGKRGISLNVRHPEGLRLAKELIKLSDVVAEGFSPGVMDRWGLGYEELKRIRPEIIYAQQSGMGAAGTYGRVRVVGPIAAALSGVTEMSGLEDPAPPAGWGYSYLDWLAAYSFASAILSALYEREQTGHGQYVDASQCEVGIYASALAIADWSANGHVWQREGNKSRYHVASPQGVYRCRGDDRWIAISCESDEQWASLATILGEGGDSRSSLRHLSGRVERRAELDALVQRWTETRDAYEAMERLQRAGVPAGVCQTAEDRCDRDEQLRHLGWLSEVTGTKIGTWPIGEVPVRMSSTPPFVGGRLGRGAPGYGEDNYEVYGELLGLSTKEIDRLRTEGVV